MEGPASLSGAQPATAQTSAAAAHGAAHLARSESHSPLLPCGLTAEELAAITAASAGGNEEGAASTADVAPSAGGPRSASPLAASASRSGASSDPSPAAAGSPQAAAPRTPSGLERPPSDHRRSFERVNRVAAAVAAEKARRRSVERQQFRLDRPRSQGQLARRREAQPAPHPPQGLVLMSRQRSASEGQLEALLGPNTPRRSADSVTAAQRLAAIAPGPAAAPAAQRAHPPAAAAAEGRYPRPVRSSAPALPSAWREQLLAQHVGAGGSPPARPFGPHAADPQLQPVAGGRYSADDGPRQARACSAKAAPLAASPPPPVDACGTETPAPTAAPRSTAGGRGWGGPPLAAGQPHLDQTSASVVLGAATSGAGSAPRGCLPVDPGRGGPDLPHAVILCLTKGAGQERLAAGRELEASGSPPPRSGLLSVFGRLLRL